MIQNTNLQRKNKLKVLLLEKIHPLATDLFREQGFEVTTVPQSLDKKELKAKIKDFHILGIRSKTQITSDIINAAEQLLAIGAFCIGTNQIDLNTCAKQGIVVFNAPYSNTRSVVELVVGEMIGLIRGIFDKCSELHQGNWNKSARGNHEVRGKTLGIVGYGNIGTQLSILAESLGMRVIYYDLEDKLSLGNARQCTSLEQLLKRADIISIHVDGRPSNTNLIGEAEFAVMKDGVYFLNLSRGYIVDLKALVKYIRQGKIAGTAIDVFPQEPATSQAKFKTELQNLPNTIITPHIGGSTEEAQRNIGQFVPAKIFDFIFTGSTMNSVNFPNLQLPELKDAHRLIHIHNNVPGILAKINHIFAKHNINIDGQYLKTNSNIGYVITDIMKAYQEKLIDEINSIPETIRLRRLY